MNEKQQFGRFYLMKSFIWPTLIYLLGVAIYILITLYMERNKIIDGVDERLLQAVSNLPQVLTPEFHDRAITAEAISDSENYQNIRKLSRYAKIAGLTYLYTTVVLDGKVYFTSSSATDEEMEENDLPTYWQEYPEATPEFIHTIEKSTPTFESSTDRWGTFESAIIRMYSTGGKPYLVGADMEVSFIREKLLQFLPEVLIKALFFLLLVIPFFYMLRQFYRKSQEKMITEIAERKMAQNELNDIKVNLEELVRTRTIQLEQEVEERKQIEVELEKAKEIAIRESAAKSMFLASMSHEIRTPLNGVIGMVNILKETELTPSQHEYLDIIDISGNNLLSIINDILDFSKIEAGQVELENIPFHLGQQVDEVCKILNLRAESKGLKLYYSISSDVPDIVKGDPIRYKQVVMNLTNNAIKFTGSGSVSIKIDLVWDQPEKLMIKCSVIDTGIGITESGKDRLFKEFSQIDTTVTRKYGGTGLGLKISKDLSQLMGGEIGVDSTEGKGSTFWFTAVFDKVQPSEAEKLKEAKKKKLLKDIPILLVEDNYISQKVAKSALEMESYINIDIAENGRVAVRMVEEKQYDVILMDIRMPIMDGIEATQGIRNIEKQLPGRKPSHIVAFTAYAVEGDREKFILAGMDDYVAKPFEPESLIKIIQKHALQIKAQLKSLMILLAEDNKINQKVAQKTLENMSHKVDLVDNGKEAVEMFKRKSYDVILMDIEMPEIDGVEATRIIRRLEQELILRGEREKKIKIVALTAHSTTDDRVKCLQSGMDDYISKPFRQAEINRALTLEEE